MFQGRLMTMSPSYPCGKPRSRGTHNETAKNLALFSSIINGIMKESRLRISIPWECFQFSNQIENSIPRTNDSISFILSQVSKWYFSPVDSTACFCFCFFFLSFFRPDIHDIWCKIFKGLDLNPENTTNHTCFSKKSL